MDRQMLCWSIKIVIDQSIDLNLDNMYLWKAGIDLFFLLENPNLILQYDENRL